MKSERTKSLRNDAVREAALPAPPIAAQTEPRQGAAPGTLRATHTPRDSIARRSLAAADVLGFVAALLVAAAATEAPLLITADWRLTIGGVIFWLALLRALKLYDVPLRRVGHVQLDEFPQVLQAAIPVALLAWWCMSITQTDPIGAEWALWFGGSLLATCTLLRATTQRLVRWWIGPQRALLIGSDPILRILDGQLRANRRFGIKPVLLVPTERVSAEDTPKAAGEEDATDLDTERIHALIGRERIDHVIISSVSGSPGSVVDLLESCRRLPLQVTLLPTDLEAMGQSVVVGDVAGTTLISLRPLVLSRTSRITKRATDIAGAAAGLTLAAPLLLVIAVVIRADSRGPILFRQERLGRNETSFRILKFRTMLPGADKLHARMLADSHDPNWLRVIQDPRITRVGHFLRRTSLDELPQLWNVLVGEMSLVGPRPLIAAENSNVTGRGIARSDLRPGVTGLWQVLGRTDLTFAEMIQLDYIYATNWSLWTDLSLILRTVPAVAKGTGAN